MEKTRDFNFTLLKKGEHKGGESKGEKHRRKLSSWGRLQEERTRMRVQGGDQTCLKNKGVLKTPYYRNGLKTRKEKGTSPAERASKGLGLRRKKKKESKNTSGLRGKKKCTRRKFHTNLLSKGEEKRAG